MARENKTKLAVLGLLSVNPMSGYDMKKKIDKSLSFFWNENYGHLYPVLNALETGGLIAKTVTKGEGRPDRNVYEITEAGKEELRQWFPKPNDPVRFRSELLLKIFFGAHADRETLISMVEQERRQHENLLFAYDEIEKHIHDEDYRQEDRAFWHMALQNGRSYSRSQIAWCEETLGSLKSMKLSFTKGKKRT